MECIFYAAFLFFTYKTAALYFENSRSMCPYLITVVVGMAATCCDDFMTGGQCEELVLPFLTATIYVVVRYFRQQYPAKIRFLDILWIGICFSMIFWMKYTICGMYLGLVLFVIVLQVKDRKIRNLFSYMGQFLLAFLIGSLPVLVYFGITGSFESLFESYFYNLMFLYPGGNYTKGAFFLSEEFVTQYLGSSMMLESVIIFFLLSGKRHFCTEEKTAIIAMLVFECFGVSVSYNWEYSSECLYAFSVFGVTIIALLVMDLDFLAELAKKVRNAFRSIPHVEYIVAAAAVGLLLWNSSYLLLELELTAAVLVCRISWRKCRPWIYVLIGVIGCVTKMFYETEFLANICLLFLLFQLPLLYEYLKRQLPAWKREYEGQKRKYQIITWCASVVVCLVFLGRHSVNLPDATKKLEDYPQYQISECIKRESNDPVIIYYEGLDFGIYWLTGYKNMRL